MPDHDTSCSLLNRDETLEAYVLGKLTTGEEEQFEAHIYECEVCFRELQFQEDLRQVANRITVDRMAYLQPLPAYRAVITSGRAWLVAAAVLLALVIAGIYQVTLPIYFSQAELTEMEREYLQAGLRGESQRTTDADEAARAMLAARKNRIPFFPYFPYFNKNQAERAETHFSNEFEKTDNAVKRNQYAYLIAKACLMQTDVENACVWLQRIVDSPAKLYKDRATELRRKIACQGI